MTGLRQSLFWSAVRHWANRLGSALVFFVLARVLRPEDLGLFAAAASIIAFAEIFAENGLGDAVVQAPTIDAETLSAALWLNVILGMLVTLVLFFASPIIETLVNAPGLAALLSVATLAILLNSISYVPQSLLRRRNEFRRLAARGVAATSISGAVGVGLAFSGFGAWSMVAQFLLFALLNTILVWVYVPFAVRRPKLSPAVDLLRYGWKVLGAKILFYLATRSIEIVIVSALGPATLALYIMGQRLCAIAMQLIAAVTLDVSLPMFSRLSTDREALHRTYYQAIEFAAALGSPVLILLAALSPEITSIAFGSNGLGSERILFPVALYASFQLLHFFNGTLLNSIGRPDVSLVLQFIEALMTAFVLTLTFGSELQIVVLAFVLGQGLLIPFGFFLGKRYVSYEIKIVLVRIWPFFLASGFMLLAVLLIRRSGFLSSEAILNLLVLGAIAGVVYLASVALLNRAAMIRVASGVLGRRGRGADTQT